MPTLRQSTQVARKDPVLSSDGTGPIVIFGDIALPAGTVINDVLEMVPLPAGYVPVDVIVDAEDADSGAALVLNAGIISGDYGVADNARTCGAEFITGSTVGQAGGIARMAVSGGTRVAPTTGDRGIGLKVATAAATLTAGANISMTLLARPAINGA